MKRIITAVFLASFVLTVCAPGVLFGATITPTPTRTKTATVTPTFTPTLPPTGTPTLTPTPLPGLGVRADEFIDSIKDLFSFHSLPDFDGQAVQKGVTPEGFSTITLTGSPYIVRAELRIDRSRENGLIATGYWILFLEAMSHGGKEAADWVHDNFSVAIKNGKVEKTFGRAKVMLESDPGGAQFVLTVLPADAQ